VTITDQAGASRIRDAAEAGQGAPSGLGAVRPTSPVAAPVHRSIVTGCSHRIVPLSAHWIAPVAVAPDSGPAPIASVGWAAASAALITWTLR